jgi:hypothetical protein
MLRHLPFPAGNLGDVDEPPPYVHIYVADGQHFLVPLLVEQYNLLIWGEGWPKLHYEVSKIYRVRIRQTNCVV